MMPCEISIASSLVNTLIHKVSIAGQSFYGNKTRHLTLRTDAKSKVAYIVTVVTKLPSKLAYVSIVVSVIHETSNGLRNNFWASYEISSWTRCFHSRLSSDLETRISRIGNAWL